MCSRVADVLAKKAAGDFARGKEARLLSGHRRSGDRFSSAAGFGEVPQGRPGPEGRGLSDDGARPRPPSDPRRPKPNWATDQVDRHGLAKPVDHHVRTRRSLAGHVGSPARDRDWRDCSQLVPKLDRPSAIEPCVDQTSNKPTSRTPISSWFGSPGDEGFELAPLLIFSAPLPFCLMASSLQADISSSNPAARAEAIRLRRLRKDAERPMSVNLAEGIALSHQLMQFTGAARRN